MRVLVGLGNPGEQYLKTRHNAGFLAVDAIARELGASWKTAHAGEVAKVAGGYLFKPGCYMNRSGEPIVKLLNYYKIEPNDACIVADEVYLAPGSARIRKGGADGGHNGWKSVIQQLGSEGYLRVRLGVGPYEQNPELRQRQAPLDQFVLEPLHHDEHKRLEHLIDRLTPDLIGWLTNGELAEATIHL